MNHSIEGLIALVEERFRAAKLNSEHAEIVPTLLVRAEAEGRSTHGLVWLPTYIRGLRQGAINPAPQITAKSVLPTKTLISGDHGLGYVPALLARGSYLRIWYAPIGVDFRQNRVLENRS